MRVASLQAPGLLDGDDTMVTTYPGSPEGYVVLAA